MYGWILLVLLGEALVFWSHKIALAASATWMCMELYLQITEERGLRRRFGHAYDQYQRQVPRWFAWSWWRRQVSRREIFLRHMRQLLSRYAGPRKCSGEWSRLTEFAACWTSPQGCAAGNGTGPWHGPRSWGTQIRHVSIATTKSLGEP